MPYMKAYKGRLEVEDEAFELRAERFSVRARDAERRDIFEVAFRLGGPYDGDAYWVEGTSKQVADGRYVSGRLRVSWRQHTGVDEAEIVMMRVEETPAGCNIVGEWSEYGDRYRFFGLLEPFLVHAGHDHLGTGTFQLC